MAKLSYAELRAVVSGVVDEDHVSTETFDVTRNNIVGLIDKIGKIVVLDTQYQSDKLAMFDGEYLPFGKTIEEWSMDLTLPQDYDSTGEGTLAPTYQSFRPVFYSYTLGRKVIPVTIPNNDIERAVNNEAELVSIVSMFTKRMGDSMSAYRYELKRHLVGLLCSLCIDALDSDTYSNLQNYSVGTYLTNSNGTQKGIVVKKISAMPKTWEQHVAEGNIIVLDLVETLEKPVDAQSGEAFIKSVKKAIEKAQDLNEGNSLNGNSLGATEGLVLIVKQGIIPTLEVDTYAGAFNKEELAFPVEIVVIKDFGDAPVTCFAVLCDKRGIRLHNTYRATRENVNAKGDFMNIFDHTEDTGYISRNTFVKIFKEA